MWKLQKMFWWSNLNRLELQKQENSIGRNDQKFKYVSWAVDAILNKYYSSGVTIEKFNHPEFYELMKYIFGPLRWEVADRLDEFIRTTMHNTIWEYLSMKENKEIEEFCSNDNK